MAGKLVETKKSEIKEEVKPEVKEEVKVEVKSEVKEEVKEVPKNNKELLIAELETVKAKIINVDRNTDIAIKKIDVAINLLKQVK